VERSCSREGELHLQKYPCVKYKRLSATGAKPVSIASLAYLFSLALPLAGISIAGFTATARRFIATLRLQARRPSWLALHRCCCEHLLSTFSAE
jgi:hypothetical protein